MMSESMSRSSCGAAVDEGKQPMSPVSLMQMRGVVDLVHEVVSGSLDAIEEAHQSIAHKPFAVLEKLSPSGAPVRLIEHMERTITSGVYQSIRLANRLVAAVATQVVDWLEETGEPPPSR